MKKNLFIITTILVFCILHQSCSDELNVQQSYEFAVTTLPVQANISKGETAEIRCRLVKQGEWENTKYYIRYFQPEGKGVVKLQDGTVLFPNDLYELTSDIFRIYYTSYCEDGQTIDLYFEDSSGNMFILSFSFNNQSTENKIDNKAV